MADQEEPIDLVQRNVKIDEARWAKVSRMAERLETSRSWVIRRLIDKADEVINLGSVHEVIEVYGSDQG